MPFRLRLLLFYINHLAKQIDYEKASAPEVRAINEATRLKVKNLIDYPPISMYKVWEEQVRMRDKAMIPIRIYQPSDKTNLPIIVFYHGGGFVTRNLDSHDTACRKIAKTNEAIVISVGYRLAPEYKFPIPLQDAYDATVWASENTSRLGGNKEGLIVMGDSAGGNLATVVAILSRNLKGPKIKYQVLIYPTTDARLNHPSFTTYGKGYFLTKALIDWFSKNYKRNESDTLNPLMSPLLEKDLTNLPPAFVCTAEYDPLKDEGAAYAKRLKEAGNTVIFKEYKGVTHGFLNLPRITTKGTAALHEDIRQALKV